MTRKRKQEILQSRLKSTRLLYKVLNENLHQVEAVISASAIGYYGFGLGEDIFSEESSSGNDFLATVTKQWENEVDKFQLLKIRTAKIRIGIVLSKNGGALKEMASPIKLGLGSPLGSGKQYLSWIHIDDLCKLFIMGVDDKKFAGAFNGVTSWSSNKEFTTAIAEAIKRPLWLPNVPAFVLRLLIGEMASMILNGSKVSNKKILAIGFQPAYPTLELALNNLLT